MRDIVLEHVARGGRIRLLDLGCGTGSLMRRLAGALPESTLVGIDVSAANVEAAIQQSGGDAHARFVVADYLQYRDEPFDVIVSDGVLHLIPGPTSALAAKLGADLRAGGVLVCGMPYDCFYNRAFSALRRVLRAVRSKATDRVILAAARLLHRGDMDDQGLRERLDYMYVPPVRVMGPVLVAALNAAGLRLAATHSVRHTSPSQLRHNVTVWTKVSAAA